VDAPEDTPEDAPADAPTDTPAIIPATTQEVVIIVGSPASGKSTMTRRYFEPAGYIRVNRDTLGTKLKCIKYARTALVAGKSIVIDNTNPSVEDRAPYIIMAKERNINVRCIRLQTDAVLCNHLNIIREVSHGTRRVPEVAMVMYRKKLVEPTIDEGFTSIEKVKFAPIFDKYDSMTKALFNQKT
jgi:bifunctional polynucleotide phosphatase/kinase